MFFPTKREGGKTGFSYLVILNRRRNTTCFEVVLMSDTSVVPKHTLKKGWGTELVYPFKGGGNGTFEMMGEQGEGCKKIQLYIFCSFCLASSLVMNARSLRDMIEWWKSL